MPLPLKDRSARNSLHNSVSKIPRLLKDSCNRHSDVPTDDADTVIVDAVHVSTGQSARITYCDAKLIGTGSFGVVYVATLLSPDSNREVAIKKVLQDERYKNRELQILKELRHINVVALHYYFYSVSSSASKANETYLNLVQEFVPQTLSRLIKHYFRLRHVIPLASVKLYSFQLLRGLAYIHNRNVCHRDIKPQNLLINPEQGTLKICDFGSAKVLNPSETNVSYICSRYYRAPELIFGATRYTVLIDVWSAGCVIGELLLGRPLFPGGSGVDQLVEIIKVLGTPTPSQVLEMNPNYTEFKFPHITGCPWEKLIRHRTNDSAFSVLRRLLVYSPKERASAAEILADAFFADLIFPPPGHPPNATGRLPNGRPAPQFPMEFTEDELNYLPVELVHRIRACQRAVAANEMSASMSTSSTATSDDSRRTPTNTHPARVRFHHSDDSAGGAKSGRPVSGVLPPHPPTAPFSSSATGLSRTRSLVSSADVRSETITRHAPPSLLSEHVDSGPLVTRLSVSRDRSASHQSVQGGSSNHAVTHQQYRTERHVPKRHSLYSQTSKN